MAHIRGWMGGRELGDCEGDEGWQRWVESRRRVKATIKRQTCTYNSSMCPVSGTDSHNPQDRLRQSLATVWHHTHPY